MRKHTLEATGGKTYAQMPRFATADGKGSERREGGAEEPEDGAPVDNPARGIWVTETALTTALNTAYFAESTATFVIVMGIAMLLTESGPRPHARRPARPRRRQGEEPDDPRQGGRRPALMAHAHRALRPTPALPGGGRPR